MKALRARAFALLIVLEVVGGAPVCWRKRYVPEIWGGGFEFDWGVEAFGHGLGAANDFARDSFFGAGVFEDQARFGGEALLQNDHGAVVIDADGGGVEGGGLALHGDVNAGADAEKHALAAAALVGRNAGGLRGSGGLHHGRKRFKRRDRFVRTGSRS